MLYSSRNGCFFYYDSLLFSWKVAEPTLLFLLGLEAVTSYDKSHSDILTISKYAYFEDIDLLEPLEYMEEIYDEVYSFLSKIGSVEDFEHYLRFNCYGLKLLLNEMTGTGSDRTVPVIFKSDLNKTLLDPTNVSSRVLSSKKTGMSFYDMQAQKIYDIFNDAGYDISLLLTDSSKSEYYLDKAEIESKYAKALSTEEKRQLRKDINAYNTNISTVHSERLSASEVYRLLDYKAMYAYSLGVLYGCRSLGYSDSIIWRVDPATWYNGEYLNLVKTAWSVFRFHWTQHIEDVTQSDEQSDFSEKYQGIQDNKIWNFENDTDLLNGPELASDETLCFCMYVDGDKNKSTPVMYSASTESTPSGQKPGSYLVSSFDDKGHAKWEWQSIDNILGESKGLVSSRGMAMVRYIGNDPVLIYKAISYTEDENTKYLAPIYNYTKPPQPTVIESESEAESDPADSSDETEADEIDSSKEDEVEDTEDEELDEEIEGPRYKKYYVYTGHLGWVDYNEKAIIDYTHSKYPHNYLYVIPKSVSKDKLEYARLKDDTGTSGNVVVTCYKCYVTDRSVIQSDGNEEQDDGSAILYGIYERYINKAESVTLPTHFDKIISAATYNSLYENASSAPSRYSSHIYYDLSTPISLMTTVDDYIWNGDDSTENDKHIGYYGYSVTPSVEITLYYSNSTSKEAPDSRVFRYNATQNQLWSYDYFTTRQWHNKEDLSAEFYKLTNSVVNIYKCETKQNLDLPVYNNYSKSTILTSRKYDEYVYLKDSSSEYKFTLIGSWDYKDSSQYSQTLYSKGLTSHICPAVLKDDNGNSLTNDDNEPLVWYDTQAEVYWNGLFGINRWQKTKPSKAGKSMYDCSDQAIKPVFIYEETNSISIDGAESITLDEFYSNSNYGIIAKELQVFNPDNEAGIITCYCDTKQVPDNLADAIYCIPNVTSHWCSRAEISALGYWFVDGTATLYSGTSSENVVVDDDHAD